MKVHLEFDLAPGASREVTRLAATLAQASEFLARHCFAGTHLTDGDSLSLPGGRLNVSAFHARNGGPCYSLAQIRYGSGFRHDARFTQVGNPVADDATPEGACGTAPNSQLGGCGVARDLVDALEATRQALLLDVAADCPHCAGEGSWTDEEPPRPTPVVHKTDCPITIAQDALRAAGRTTNPCR